MVMIMYPVYDSDAQALPLEEMPSNNDQPPKP